MQTAHEAHDRNKKQKGGLLVIYTVTFNPSLDYIIEAEAFQPGATNRTSYEQLLVGGKGINVSYVLKNLGFESTALGFLAGFTGEEIRRRLNADGIHTDFLMLPTGISRINIKMKTDGTEINGSGPNISPDQLETLRQKLCTLTNGDTLILAGSIPQSIPDTIYREIMTDLKGKGIRILVDATKNLLFSALCAQPFLIKPNQHELGELFGVRLESTEDIFFYAKKLQQKGARNVLVSLGGEGALLLDENGQTYQCPAPKGRLINAVGAGDSMVAGFLAGYLETENYESAFLKGVAAGSASAFSDRLATKEEVEHLLKTMPSTVQ